MNSLCSGIASGDVERDRFKELRRPGILGQSQVRRLTVPSFEAEYAGTAVETHEIAGVGSDFLELNFVAAGWFGIRRGSPFILPPENAHFSSDSLFYLGSRQLCLIAGSWYILSIRMIPQRIYSAITHKVAAAPSH